MYDLLAEKLLTYLGLNFSHLKEHKFRHGFADMIYPMCACGADIEIPEHFLLLCHYSNQRSELFHNIDKANSVVKTNCN